MDSTVAVHTKGLGFWFQAWRKASMDECRSATLRKTPRRMALLSRWPNHLSTRFSQLELVGAVLMLGVCGRLKVAVRCPACARRIPELAETRSTTGSAC